MLKLHIFMKNERLIYGIGRSFRLIYLLFAVAIIIGASAYIAENDLNNIIFPMIIAVILLLAAGYQEQWTFDKRDRLITYKIGLLFLHKSYRYRFDQVESFELNHFKKGAKDVDSKIKSRANKLFTAFAVSFKDGEKHDIEIIRHKKSAGRTEQAAYRIAEFCSLPLTQDREFPEDH